MSKGLHSTLAVRLKHSVWIRVCTELENQHDFVEVFVTVQYHRRKPHRSYGTGEQRGD